MALDIWQVDAFADRPFAGNPAAVCVLDETREDSWLQGVAAEMNLSETAFLLRRAENWSLRWFTPTVEVDLCGHATLASAHVLWNECGVDKTRALVFETLSGVLGATWCGGLIELDFPSRPSEPVPAPPGLQRALGVPFLLTERNVDDVVVMVDDEATLRSIEPDFGALAGLPFRGILVTAPSHSDRYDFVSRFFAPAIGIDEDPVTGAAHTCLAPLWRRRLGRDEMVGFQMSSRGGEVRVRVIGDRVHLAGRAVTVLRGRLTVE